MAKDKQHEPQRDPAKDKQPDSQADRFRAVLKKAAKTPVEKYKQKDGEG